MALLFMDSFDHYVTADIAEKWSNSAGTVVISPANGRRSSASIRVTTGPAVSSPWVLKGFVPTGNVAIMGVAAKFASFSTYRICGFYDGATQRDQVFLQMNTDGSLSAVRGNQSGQAPGGLTNVTLGTSPPGVITPGVFYYIELKVLISDTVGTVTVRVNGNIVLPLVAQDTANTVLTWTGAWVGAPNCPASGILIDYDDLYVLDGSGPAPCNDFLGDIRVDYHAPNAVGANNASSPSTGVDRFPLVDDAAPNDDVDYNTLVAVGDKDTYNMEALKAGGASILGIQVVASVKKADAGVGSMCPVLRQGVVDYDGTSVALGTTYAYVIQPYATNPATGGQFLETEFNALEVGVKRTV